MIYTIGYARLSPERLHELVIRFDCTLIDVRGAPFSRKPGFSGKALRQRFGERYLYAGNRGLGNKNGQHVTEEGIALLKPFDGRKKRHAMLMCLEEAAWECQRHRQICGPYFPAAMHIVGPDLFFADDVEAGLVAGPPYTFKSFGTL
jgi:uncharacterized protein (DUF488 family)